MKNFAWLALISSVVLSGCATNPCSVFYDERSEIDRFIHEPGYARQHIRYPLRYSEIEEGELILSTEIDEPEMLARHEALRRERALSEHHQQVAVPIRLGDNYEVRAGPVGLPATDIYILEPGLCQITLVEYRHYR